MNYLAISDAHIGSRELKEDEIIVDKILSLSDKYDKLIFNGDMFEAWEYGKFGWNIKTRSCKIREIFNKFPKFKDFIYSEKCIVIIGNHDIALEVFGFKRRKLIINDIYITHGNECSRQTSYKYIKNKNSSLVSLKSKVKIYISKILNNLGMISVKEPTSKFNDIMYNLSDENNAMEEYISKLNVKQNNIIVGHTHIQKQYDVNGKHIYNCGRCSPTLIQGVVINDGDITQLSIKI